ncbi:MAG: hypothetical protein HFG80_06690 [Eubacterium sp.]|nr:hypothetical protein [Eubacterium sp.]
MKKKKTAYAVIILFFLLIGTAYLVWPLAGRFVDTENHEKRELAVRPVFQISTISEYPKQFESWLNDHLPFRNQLIRLNCALDYYVFRSSTSDRVAVGSSGWLFYTDFADGNPLANYQGTDLLTEKQLKKIADNMIATRDNLAKENIEFVIFIAPNKERIYDEYMPKYYGAPAEEYAVRQICDYLKEHTDIRIVYPIEEMKEAEQKLGEQMLLYHKTDTHWNELGAYIGGRELLAELGIDMPAYDSPEISVAEIEDTPGDMADILNLSTLINPGYTYAPSGYDGHNFVNDMWEFSTEVRYHAQGADPRTIFVCRDSFGSALGNLIGSQFDRSVLVHNGSYTNDYVEQEEPDVFVYECVERYAASGLLEFRYE